jgi:hypothetical protein
MNAAEPPIDIPNGTDRRRAQCGKPQIHVDPREYDHDEKEQHEPIEVTQPEHRRQLYLA